MARDQAGTGDRRGRRRGAALLLVLLAVSVSLVAALTYMTGATTTTDLAVVVDDHAQSRQIAESALAIAIAYTERTPDWRQRRSPGAWVGGLALLGGEASVSAAFEPPGAGAGGAVTDAGFEEEAVELPSPLVSPPMSGVIGGWEVSRTALLATGPTSPRIGVEVSADATEGLNRAFVGFGASVTGSGMFAQALGGELAPRHFYQVSVDIGTGGPDLSDVGFGFRVLAGSAVVASTDESLPLGGGLLSGGLLASAQALLVGALEPSTLEIEQLGSSVARYTMRFATGDDPPAGPLRLEIEAEAAGLVASASFDNVQFSVESNEPLRLTAVGRRGRASHTATATVVRGLGGDGHIIEWGEQ